MSNPKFQLTSADYDWTPPFPGETFAFLNHEWNIEQAFNLIATTTPRPIYALSPQYWHPWVGDPEDRWSEPDANGMRRLISTTGLIYVDWSFIHTMPLTKLAFPAILAPIETNSGARKLLPLDGWHRIGKAITANVDTLSYVLLTESEEGAIRIS